MQQGLLKASRFAVPAAAILAMGACFPSGQTEVAAVPDGTYGGTVVAYPAPAYYSPYGYGYDYGLPLAAPYLGFGYGYGYSPYLYAAPQQVIVRPAPQTYRYAVPRGSAPARTGLYGMRSPIVTHPLGGMHAVTPGHDRFTLPPLRPSTGATAQPRPSFSPPPQHQHMTPPPPRPQQFRHH